MPKRSRKTSPAKPQGSNEISIFVSGAPRTVLDPKLEVYPIWGSGPASRDVRTHDSDALTIGEVVGRVVKVRADKFEGQWKQTLDTLTDLGTAISNRASGWKIDEIEVGLTLSTKGELLFIAEASAAASIKLKLKPKT